MKKKIKALEERDVHGGPKVSRREALKRGGKLAVALAASATFSPWMFRARAQAGETLTFWQFHAPDGPFAARSAWFEDMISNWNEQNDVEVRLEFVPVTEYLEGTRLQTAFSAGEGPDIFVISPGDFLRYYNGGVLADLTPFMDDAARDDYFPGVMGTRTVDGRIYALPLEVQPLAMFYSVQAFEEAGLSEADVPTTWEDLTTVARRLSSDDRFGVLFETNPGYYQNFTWYPFMWQGGGEVVADGGRDSSFDSDATVQALRFWQELVQEGLAPRTGLGTGANDVVANLASGYCAMQNVGIWGISALRDNAPDFEYGVFKLPVPAGGSYTTGMGGWAFVANSRGRNPEAAARFCVWALGSMDEGSVERVADWCGNVKSDIAPRRSALELATARGAYDAGPMRTFVEEIFPGGRSEPRVPPEVHRAVSDAIQACQLGGADPVGEAARASDTIDAFLAGYVGAAIR